MRHTHPLAGHLRVLIAVLMLLPATTAVAAERVMVVAKVEVDGEAGDPSTFEALLGDALLGQGVPLLEPDAAARLRAAVDAERAATGTVPAGAAALDAEWILAAKATCKSRQETGVMRRVRGRTGSADRIHSANCTAALTLLRADTSEVAGKASLGGAGAAAYGHEAVRRALGRIAAEWEHEHLEAWARRMRVPRPLVLWVFGLPGRAQRDAFVERLAKIDGVRARRVTREAEGALRLEVDTGLRGPELGRRLRQAGLEIAVEQASAHTLTLRWDPAAGLRTKIFFRPFSDGIGDPRLATRVRIASGRLAALLAGEPWVAFASLPEEATLVVGGRMVRGRKGALALRVAVKDGAGHEVLTLRSSDVDPEAALARQLSARLPRAIARYARRRRNAAWAAVFRRAAPRLKAAERSARLALTGSEVEPIFPARAVRYQGAPLGSLRVRAEGDEPLEVVAAAEVVGFSAGPRLAPPVVLRPGGPTEVPLYVALDEARLRSLGSARGGQVRVTLSYREAGAGGAPRSERFVLPVTLHERSAIDWSVPESAAAFVAPRSPGVGALVAAALRAPAPDGADALTPEVRRAIQVLAVLSAQRPRYRPDPVLPFGAQSVDYVRLPDETLAEGAGDCDDLSVLTAAALEAAGVATRLVETPGHLLLAFDSGLPAAFAPRVGLTHTQVLSVAGRGWIPVEATALAKGPWEAIEKGTEALRAEGRSSFALRRAWRTFPPLPSDAPAPRIEVPAGAGRDALARLLEARTKALGAPLPEGDALARARALAARGEMDAALSALPEETKGEAALLRAGLLAVRGEFAKARALLEATHPANDELRLGRDLDLALVAWMGGDTEAAMDRLQRLVAQGVELPPWAETDAALGADPSAGEPVVIEGDLARLLTEARRRNARFHGRLREAVGDTRSTGGDRSARGEAIVSGGRRGADPEARRALATLLYWP